MPSGSSRYLPSSLITKVIYEAPWFRGAGDARFKLLPGLYRGPEGQTKFADDELRSEFSRKALPLVAGRTPRDEWGWYFLI
jgi:hypothetical protein